MQKSVMMNMGPGRCHETADSRKFQSSAFPRTNEMGLYDFPAAEETEKCVLHRDKPRNAGPRRSRIKEHVWYVVASDFSTLLTTGPGKHRRSTDGPGRNHQAT